MSTPKQLFYMFNYRRGGRGHTWTKDRFDRVVMSQVELYGGTFKSLRKTFGWTLYAVLIPVESVQDAIEKRKVLDNLHRKVTKESPYGFKVLNHDRGLEDLDMWGETIS